MSQQGTVPTDEAPRERAAGQALVVTGERADATRHGEAKRPDAAFLTQILASKSHMGPFRRGGAGRWHTPAQALGLMLLISAIPAARTRIRPPANAKSRPLSGRLPLDLEDGPP
jgi:hypothetical protein